VKYITVFILLLFSNLLLAEDCAEIKHFDELMSEIYVVCPNLNELAEPEMSIIVEKIFSSRKFIPDEYIVNFVLSTSGLPPNKLTSENHIGWYYTHDHKIRIWPKNKSKSKEIQLVRR